MVFSYKKGDSKKADLTQVTLQAMFADSILIRVSPAEDGFVCSIVENNTDNLPFETAITW